MPTPSRGSKIPRSRAAFRRALESIPGGVNSPVRAFRSVGGDPVFVRFGRGSRITDLDGRRYLDYVGSWGPLILGHAHPALVSAVAAALRRGSSFGAPTEGETGLAELIREALPSCAKVRFVSSGTEACMSALRVARAATGRGGVVKFEGCYHGHADSFLVKAGSGAATLGIPTSPGVPDELARLTHVLPYNDPLALERLLATKGRDIALVIVEPVVGNMGVVPPSPDFLEALRRLTRAKGVLLCFDEVMTGFRVAWGGAQRIFGIEPDLTTLGKVVGGGLPLAAYGGRADLMAKVAPEGPVYQAGTLSGNPLAVAAGIAQLRILRRQPAIYARLEERSAELEAGLLREARAAGVPACVNRMGSMMTLFFQEGPVADWDGAARSDTARYGRWFHAMLDRGVYLPPSQYEAFFVSAAHSAADIRATIAAARPAFRSL